MAASVKLQSSFDYEANVDSYMKIYRSDVWNRYRNDEFVLHDKRQETIEMMKEHFSSFPLDEEFVLRTTLKFGDYDFSNEEFPVDGFGESTYFHDSRWRSGSFPSTYKVFLTNPNKVGNLEMAKNEAKSFLQSRKNNFGVVNREIYVKLTLSIEKLKNGKDEFLAKITEAEFYEDNQFNDKLQKF